MLMLMLMSAGAAWGYDPPVLIGTLSGEPDSGGYFGATYTCLGDQNGDGCDDILVFHNYELKLYFGGRQIDNTPDMIFRPQTAGEGYYGYGTLLGRLNDENDHWFVIRSYIHEGDRFVRSRLNFYKGGRDLDTIPDLTLTTPAIAHYSPVGGFRNRQIDVNGDGYDDLICFLSGDVNDQPGYLQIFFGGEEFDTIPDWTKTYPYPRWEMGNFRAEMGGDVNGDGYQDFLVFVNAPNGGVYRYELFLGGNPPDTTASLVMVSNPLHPGRYEYLQMRMLPDVNGDGYDDWGCHWDSTAGQWEYDGYYLWFGSEHPDSIPDLDLEGNHRIWGLANEMAGGDFNGDGYGDIVTANGWANMGEGEVHIYFGSNQIDGRADISITMREAGIRTGHSLGGIGDYNGDSCADYVAAGGEQYGYLEIYSKADDWPNKIDNEQQIVAEDWNLVMSLAPNPFNSLLSITVSSQARGDLDLSLFDVTGRPVWRESRIRMATRSTTFQINLEGLSSGVYLVRVAQRNPTGVTQVQTEKAVLLR
jgi:hypothetical protein